MIENFGSNVARLRKQRGMTQIELAQEIGVNKQTISNIEKGVSYPNFNNLEKISQALNCTCVELFGTAKEVEFLRVGRFLNIIASALEKQKLKRPDYEGDGCDCEGDIIFDTWICPRCKERYEVDYDRYDYCPSCGQGIDWSDDK